eukprot:CAMPEP_0196694770 /NCGR_PEP_ID=MMETSP1090-20130531/34795_1 /TAXON_ID=37098 /ORGANISM="Isochrysis sp, Strain CCMP1244" /LENGTH=46 /DNA_ID= /DNA_START= /DNA_END= /DNA_ORIENTATION=
MTPPTRRWTCQGKTAGAHHLRISPRLGAPLPATRRESESAEMTETE